MAGRLGAENNRRSRETNVQGQQDLQGWLKTKPAVPQRPMGQDPGAGRTEGLNSGVRPLLGLDGKWSPIHEGCDKGSVTRTRKPSQTSTVPKLPSPWRKVPGISTAQSITHSKARATGECGCGPVAPQGVNRSPKKLWDPHLPNSGSPLTCLLLLLPSPNPTRWSDRDDHLNRVSVPRILASCASTHPNALGRSFLLWKPHKPRSSPLGPSSWKKNNLVCPKFPRL